MNKFERKCMVGPPRGEGLPIKEQVDLIFGKNEHLKATEEDEDIPWSKEKIWSRVNSKKRRGGERTKEDENESEGE